MKVFFLSIFLLLSAVVFSQELVDYELHPDLSLKMPVDSEEAEDPVQKYSMGLLDQGYLVVVRTDKDHDKLLQPGKTDYTKYFEGLKNGMVKKAQGELVEDTFAEIDGEKVILLKYHAVIEGEKRLVECYAFLYKKATYLLQFISAIPQSEEFRKSKIAIVESVDMK